MKSVLLILLYNTVCLVIDFQAKKKGQSGPFNLINFYCKTDMRNEIPSQAEDFGDF